MKNTNIYKKYAFAAALLISVSLLAACGADTKTSSGSTGGAVSKSGSGCLACHGVTSWRVLPSSHAGYANDMCLGCHSTTGFYNYSSGSGKAPYIPHSLGKTN